ncbi:hypothetical protein HMPREF0204_12789 [Chryseobacterium gleum ATCC 35910]|uniref:Uncharacterized protein n=1 Tax=Chryseobacterium gleum ATCC 35910 TaxID=525257 RepID=A0ABN0AKZ3_CHRGE|nr:hypothetical protein HMPREF0204_12789 [Chryseobacterium gleum ATCC 35910]
MKKIRLIPLNLYGIMVGGKISFKNFQYNGFKEKTLTQKK